MKKSTRKNKTIGQPEVISAKGTRNGSIKAACQLAKPEPKNQTASLAPVFDDYEPSESKTSRIWYVIDLAATRQCGVVCVSLCELDNTENDSPCKVRYKSTSRQRAEQLGSDDDRKLIEQLVDRDYYAYWNPGDSVSFAITVPSCELLLPRLSASRRLMLIPANATPRDGQERPMVWDDGPAWQLRLSMLKSPDKQSWQICGRLVRGTEVEELSSPLELLNGLAFFPDRIAKFDAGGAFSYVEELRKSRNKRLRVQDAQKFVERSVQSRFILPMDWPPELLRGFNRPTPQPLLTIFKPKRRSPHDLVCRLSFEYGDHRAPFAGKPIAWYDRKSRVAVCRDFSAEDAAKDSLIAAQAHRSGVNLRKEPGGFRLAPANMPSLVRQMVAAGWRVQAEGRLVRRSGKISFNVTSDADWFELKGACDFGGVQASLPQVLKAIKKGEHFIRLGDGSIGILPEVWLARLAKLAEFGPLGEQSLRFYRPEATVLNELLAAQQTGTVNVDETFKQFQKKLRSFGTIKPRKEPKNVSSN